MDTITAMMTRHSNIVGGPKCGGFEAEPDRATLDCGMQVVWAFSCRSNPAAWHTYYWDSDRDLWRYAGAGPVLTDEGETD